MTRLVRTLTAAAAAALGGIAPGGATLGAQQPSSDTTTLSPVVVTATRVAVPGAAATVTTTVITGAELRARGITSLRDALGLVPGVFAPPSGSYGAQTSLFVRGGQSDYAQVLVDGVPVNDPGGFLDIANLTTDDVDRIEVVRGPASVLYGANAVTGVVQIFTRDGAAAAGSSASLSARGGSYGSGDEDATFIVHGERMSASLAAARHRSDGIYAFNSAYRNDTYAGRWRFVPDTRTTVHAALRYIDAGAHIPTNYYGAVVDSNQFHLEQRWTGSVDAARRLGDRLQAHLLLDATNARTRSADLPDTPGESCDVCYDTHAVTLRRGGDARMDYFARPDVVLSAGASYERQRQHEAGSDPRGRVARALYAQAVGTVARSLSFTAGARVDDNSQFGTFGTYRISAGWRTTGGTVVRASFGTAFKEPTFDQTSSMSPFVRGNPALRPERARSWEAGVAQEAAHGALLLSATAFRQRFRDVIQYNPSPPDSGAPNYYNLAAANADGFELGVHLSAGRAWTAGADYTRLDTRVTDAGDDAGPAATFVAGDRLLRRPANTFGAQLGFRPSSSGAVHLDVRYIGSRTDIDFQRFVRADAPAFTTVALSGDIVVRRAAGDAPSLTLTLRVDNLFDARYEPILGFRAPGRAVMAGARIGWGRE